MCGETHLLLLSQVKLMNSSYHQEPRAAPGSIRPGTRPTLCKQQAEAAQRAASMQELNVYAGARLVLPRKETGSSVLSAQAGNPSSPMGGVLGESHNSVPEEGMSQAWWGRGNLSGQDHLCLAYYVAQYPLCDHH